MQAPADKAAADRMRRGMQRIRRGREKGRTGAGAVEREEEVGYRCVCLVPVEERTCVEG